MLFTDIASWIFFQTRSRLRGLGPRGRGRQGPKNVGHRGNGPRPCGSAGNGPPAKVRCNISRARRGVNLHHGTITGLNIDLGSSRGNGHTMPFKRTVVAASIKHTFVMLFNPILR